jgi:hypothetical protein
MAVPAAQRNNEITSGNKSYRQVIHKQSVKQTVAAMPGAAGRGNAALPVRFRAGPA